MSSNLLLWIIFGVTIATFLALDLAVFNRRKSGYTMKEAVVWSVFWISLALIFNVAVYYWRGSDTALEFLTGYLIEESLSVDNLFVFLMLFSYFRVAKNYQHKVLFWGILGVLVMRAIFIFVGIALIQRLHWLIYVFGAFLIFTAIKMALQKDKEILPEKNPVLKIFRKLMPVTEGYEGDKFFVKRACLSGRQAGKLFATPLFVVLLVVETTDVVFAVDSIPAILAITTDPFVVYTSNIFAVLGLRALFFVLSGFMQLFHHLSYGLSIILAFVGVKMIVADFYKIPVGVALAVVAGVLCISVITSMIWPSRTKQG